MHQIANVYVIYAYHFNYDLKHYDNDYDNYKCDEHDNHNLKHNNHDHDKCQHEDLRHHDLIHHYYDSDKCDNLTHNNPNHDFDDEK